MKETLPKQGIGPYQIQAAINAVHAKSPAWNQTDWTEIVALCEVLHAMQSSPVVKVTPAIAVSYAQKPEAALATMEKVARDRIFEKCIAAIAALGMKKPPNERGL